MSRKSLGVGSLLVAVYGVFALSASARASYQIASEFDQAPLAYSLSALSAGVYLVATYSLTNQSPRWRSIAKSTIWFELIGVLTVGFLSVFLPDLFAHPSVWSYFGAGYGYIPLILPVLGLFWLRKQDAASNQA